MKPGRILLIFAGVVVASASLGGCARSAEERQLDAMREQIDDLQVDRDRADREPLAPEAADTQAAAAPARAPAPPRGPSSQSAPPPPPPVVSVGDEPQALDDSPDTEDPSPRPTLRVVGRAVSDDGTAPSSTRWTALDPEAKRAYDAALALVKAKQYDRANDALAAFLV
jgi:TolA-binding protein